MGGSRTKSKYASDGSTVPLSAKAGVRQDRARATDQRDLAHCGPVHITGTVRRGSKADSDKLVIDINVRRAVSRAKSCGPWGSENAISGGGRGHA